MLFFCELPTGQIFDIQLKKNQYLKIWSFVGTVETENAGTQYEITTNTEVQIKMEIEVTEEGDLNFYMIQDISFNEKQSVYKAIDGYLKMLSYLKLKKAMLTDRL